MHLLTLNKLWYTRHPLRWLLFPFAVMYQVITMIRRNYLQHFCQQHWSVPIIVVGNLTVGGVGKTPLVVVLAQQLQARGLRVGIVSRGYGAAVKSFPYEVSLNDAAKRVGDEPLLLAQKTGCPVVIAPDRSQAVKYLLDKYQIQVIISDDGLQHYRMGRAIEIAVIDGLRGLGNGLCLPAGPLREGAKRLKTVDFVVVNGGVWPDSYHMDLHPGELICLLNGTVIPVAALPSPVAAVAGIGHPQRFFATLDALGITFNEYIFADHHSFQADELRVQEAMVVMTEKDAVKCKEFATDNMCFLPVNAVLGDGFWEAFWSHPILTRLYLNDSVSIK